MKNMKKIFLLLAAVMTLAGLGGNPPNLSPSAW